MDPYKILGVGRDASDDEIKQAYRELARKYHPDKYIDNPLADLAQDKMKQINEAYDAIINSRSGRDSHGAQGSYGGYSGTGRYAGIRADIAAGRIAQAQSKLDAEQERGAEWYFLMGSVFYRRGMFDNARMHFQQACQMEPGNYEYRRAMDNMNYAGGIYRNTGGYYGGDMAQCTPCDLCTALICADCLCNCC